MPSSTMRFLPTDLPYEFRPPKPWDWIRPLGVWWSDVAWLRKRYRVREVTPEGHWERVRELCRQGDSVLLAPNHSDHADPHAILHLAQVYKLPLRFMGARELFDGGGLQAAVLQRMGIFSVDRDGPDIAAIKTAIEIMSAGRCPLVVFPEGEIYHHHARLDPLMEGVASIVIRAAGRVAEGKSAWLVPIAMTFRHDPEVEATFSERLSRLEERIGWRSRPGMEVDERIMSLGVGLLALKELEFFGETRSGTLGERLETMCERLLRGVEERRGKDARAKTPPERVRAARYRIRKQLLDEKNPMPKDERRALKEDLYRAFTALQAHSYPGDYLLAEPSLERRAETLLKLEEDLLGECRYEVWRTATVEAGEPFHVNGMLESGELPAKGGAGPLTRMLEGRLGGMLGE